MATGNSVSITYAKQIYYSLRCKHAYANGHADKKAAVQSSMDTFTYFV